MITKNIKKDFPILSRKINGHTLVYLDNSATTLVPKVVINELSNYYLKHKSNVHRGVHTLSEESSTMYEDSRKNIASFFGSTSDELVFVKNTTEAANIVASSFLPNLLKKGDTLLVSKLEHHSNLLPWLHTAKVFGYNIKQIPHNKDLTVDFKSLKTIDYKFLAINHISNFTGIKNDVEQIVNISKLKKAYTFIDGAQSAPHLGINVKNLGCDFFAFSGHKMYSVFGCGGLYAKKELFSKSAPLMLGGGMIKSVFLNKESTFVDYSYKFDAGTPNVGGAIALSKSIDYIKQIGIKNIEDHEQNVLNYLLSSLLKDKSIQVYGPTNDKNRVGLVSFNVKGIHSHDLASVLDSCGVAVRSGQHCTMPAHNHLKINSSTRASLALYNFKEDVDKLLNGIKQAKSIFL